MTIALDAPADLGPSKPRVTKEQIHRRQRYDKDVVKLAAADRWGNDILPAVTGVDASHFSGDQCPCPKCGGKDRFQMFDGADGATRCRQCGVVNADGLQTIMWLLGCTLDRACRAVGEYMKVEPSNGRPMPKPSTNGKAASKPKQKLDDATANFRHAVYEKLREVFGLDDHDRVALRERGFTNDQIDRVGYWSLPVSPTLKLAKHFADAGERADIGKHVPGVMPGGALKIQAHHGPGLMVPVRDDQRRIIGLRYRPQKSVEGKKYLWVSSSEKSGFVRSGSPAHVPLVTNLQDAETIRVTEAEIKADMASETTGVATVGIPGVSCWKSAVELLEKYRPAKILIAFDADATSKEGVALELSKLWRYCTTAQWKPDVRIETWPTADDGHPKGIDDALAAGVQITEMSFNASADYVEKACKEAGVSDVPRLTDLLDDLDPMEDPHDPARLARVNLHRYMEQHGGSLRFWRGQWWKYRAGHWRRISEDEELDPKLRLSINDELMKIAIALKEIADAKKDDDKPTKPIKKKPISTPLVKNVIAEMRKQCLLSHRLEMPCLLSVPDQQRFLLSLRNGILDLDRVIDGDQVTNSFLDHTPDWFCGTQLAYAFDADATCPTLNECLSISLPDDEESQKLVQEFAGYLLIPGNPFQRFLACEGEGGTGKGMLLNGVLTALVGPENTSNVDLDGFGRNQFSLIDTIGKALNVDGDVNERVVFNEALFKRFAAGERIQFELKGRDAFAQAPTAKVALGWNQRPRIRDRSHGVWRRMLLIRFDHEITREERKLGANTPQFWISSGELPGILNWAIEGLRRLYQQKGFTISPAMNKRIKEYRAELDPVSEFIDDVIKYDEKAAVAKTQFIATRSLVAAFRSWCDVNSFEMAGEIDGRAIGPAISKRFKTESVRLSTDKRERGFYGLTIGDRPSDRSMDGAGESMDGTSHQKEMNF